MKRFILIFIGAVICVVGMAQNNQDRAVIPVGVSLNAIMRLTIVSGGNIEFSFNTIEQYTNGIDNTTQYDTQFNVASSVDFKVDIEAEDDFLYQADVADTSDVINLELNNIGYTAAGGSGSAVFHGGGTEPIGLSTSAELVTDDAGGADERSYTVSWECGTTPGSGSMNNTSLLDQSPSAGRYGTNVFLILSAQ